MTQDRRRTGDMDIESHQPWMEIQEWFATQHPQERMMSLAEVSDGTLEQHKVRHCGGVISKVLLEEQGSKLVILSDPSGKIPVTIHEHLLAANPHVGNRGTAVVLFCISVLQFEPGSRSLVMCSDNLLHHVVPSSHHARPDVSPPQAKRQRPADATQSEVRPSLPSDDGQPLRALTPALTPGLSPALNPALTPASIEPLPRVPAGGAESEGRPLRGIAGRGAAASGAVIASATPASDFVALTPELLSVKVERPSAPLRPTPVADDELCAGLEF
ncbi:hypothetical protein DIPPA_29346 [Diplonema papillatum]|nr:hypothetical protein DIPPA_29346 [Diplonema papillatum]|eukprot:gene7551-11559_t